MPESDPEKSLRSNPLLYPPRHFKGYYVRASLTNHLLRIRKAYLADRENYVLVDYGCGRQRYRPLFEPAAQYIGVDLPESTYADVHLAADGSVPLDDQSADVVLSTQVLEHVEYPARYLQECHRLLKANGVLVLSTHGHWIYHPSPTDYWRWTTSGLRKVIEDSGFQIVDMQGFMGLAPTAIQFFQDALERHIRPQIARQGFWYMMQSLIALLDKLYSESTLTKDAAVFVVMATKDANPENQQ